MVWRSLGSYRQDIPEIGVTTFRPPYTPFSLAPSQATHQNLFLPIRRTADLQLACGAGADFEPVGQWRRAYTYPSAGRTSTHDRPRDPRVRNKVGLLDASTLGKIEIKGPDAAEFLDRMYTNMFSTLKSASAATG